MRTLFGGAFALALTTALPVLAAPAGSDARAEVVATAHKVIDGFNKGDMKTVNALAPAQAIMDDMPPFHWSGPTASADWLAAVQKDDARMKDTDSMSVLGPPNYVRVEGDLAYAVFPDHYTYKRAGRPVDEHGTLTINARRTPAGWRIIAWSYAAGAH